LRVQGDARRCKAVAEAARIIYSAKSSQDKPKRVPMTDYDQDKRSDAERKAAIRHSLIGWAVFIAGTLAFFVAADALLMP
jgi:hypothetical protein